MLLPFCRFGLWASERRRGGEAARRRDNGFLRHRKSSSPPLPPPSIPICRFNARILSDLSVVQSMASSLLRSRLSATLKLRRTAGAVVNSAQIFPKLAPSSPCLLLRRDLSVAPRRTPSSPRKVDIGARARQLQSRRLWTYAVTFSCIAGFIVIVLNNFQDAMVFYITPSEAMEKFAANPTRNRFRLGGLVLDGSVVHPASSRDMEFVITDLMTEILVRYDGVLPDLFREGHSVVVEGFLKPFDNQEEDGGKGEDGPKVTDSKEEDRGKGEAVPKVTDKARSGECYFKATEVLAKHDEKYMPKEVGEALERNRKKLAAAASAAAAGDDKPGEDKTI